MDCPKCHKNIPEETEVCPFCHKVLTLVCPNCKTKSKNPVCEKCGYIILEKCTKCGKMTPTSHPSCKCGYPTKSSIAYNECETDEFASLVISFSALKSIRTLLGSQELFLKFNIKLKNLLTAQLKGVEGCVIKYNDSYVINFNKELSFPTSANKAVRLGIKIANAFSSLNTRIIDELGIPLKLNITIIKKYAEELLKNKSQNSNVKLLMVKKEEKKYIKGMQIILDQYTHDAIGKDYKTDSLYSVEKDGMSVMYYELLLNNYVLPPDRANDIPAEVQEVQLKRAETKNEEKDIYGFKVFDISAKCKFEKYCTNEVISNMSTKTKIYALRSQEDCELKTSELINFYEEQGLRVIHAACTEELNYKPWGIFTQLFKDYFNLPTFDKLLNQNTDIKNFNTIKNLLLAQPLKASTAEDARFAYMEEFCRFLSSLKNTAIIIEGFENIDDTSIQTLEIYFDKFKKIVPNFVFITDSENSVHSKIKGLLRTNLYTEITLVKSSIDTLLSNFKEDASDFIQSFYYEKIKENYNGSKLYFDNAIKYLTEKDVLVSFKNKLLIKNNDSLLLPKDLLSLIKTRLKFWGKNPDASLMLAYSAFLGERIDFETLELLGVKEVIKNAKLLEESGFILIRNKTIVINNYTIFKKAVHLSLKKDIEEYLIKNILGKLGQQLDNTSLLLYMGGLSLFKEEYMLLWKNSQFAISVGDYDAYLKNCLGFLSIINQLGGKISEEDIENNKKEVFQNILMSLYSYSPAKIYSIENVLLMDAIQEEDNEKIVKLSNLMLQGALISANYTDALTLLHNILSRMPNPSLIVDGAINTKFLLLSLVNIEILFNIGDFKRCIEVSEDILSVIKPEIIEKIKPANFSTNLFAQHMLDTFRLTGFAKLINMDKDLEEFFNKIQIAFNTDLPEKECILGIKDFLNGKRFSPSDIENSTAFSKVIYLILQEYSEFNGDYKKFAQNIYQAKLLSSDIHQTQLEFFCDLLIGYSYAKLGIKEKANVIFNDILEKSQNAAIFNIIQLSAYYIARLKMESLDFEGALIIVNDALSSIQRFNNQAKIFYGLFEQMLIDILKAQKTTAINIENEEQKLHAEFSDGELSRIVKYIKPLEFAEEETIKDNLGTEVH